MSAAKGKYKPYPKYKDSGVEWLGRVPEHWDVTRLGTCFGERREKVSDSEFAPLSVTKQGVVPQMEHVAKSDDNDNRKLVLRGDFVINSRSDRKGSSGLSPLDGSVSLINTVLTPNAKIDGKFCHHLLRSYAFQEEFYRYGCGIVADLWSTKYSEMKNIMLGLAPPTEQTAIADFIERECGRIDKLVEKKQEFIALLKEKRQALITHAVTKGLDPNVEMKDSGVEWLGKVPKHWDVKKVKWCGKLRGGSGFPTDLQFNQEEEIHFYKVGDLGRSIDGIFLDSAEHTISRETAKNLRAIIIPKHTIVWAKIGAALLLNRRRVSSRPSCIDNNMTAYTPNKGVDWRWAFHWTSILNFGAFVNPGAVPSLSEGYQGELPFLLPEPEEQTRIADHIDRETNRIDRLITKTEESIALLKERKTSLITAAVTGQIDVS